ncbi:MAG: hypothetical protein Q4F30_01600 [Akkermansia sp.]|nr:hypothetical protein [Akkermansia sp.]
MNNDVGSNSQITLEQLLICRKPFDEESIKASHRKPKDSVSTSVQTMTADSFNAALQGQ